MKKRFINDVVELQMLFSRVKFITPDDNGNHVLNLQDGSMLNITASTTKSKVYYTLWEE
jgi:hypothetical protein